MEEKYSEAQTDYIKHFKIDANNIDDKKINSTAFKFAVETRAFEIELYWKRAAYFWVFIAAMFIAYFSIISTTGLPENLKYFFAFIIACTGFSFTFSWFYANKGSKHWQKNWENHIDLLENCNMGPLYKTILFSPSKINPLKNPVKYVLSSEPYSVTKINQLISLFVLILWLFLGFTSIISITNNSFGIAFLSLIFLAITFLFSFAVWKYTKNELPPNSKNNFSVSTRISKINEEQAN